MNVAEVDRVWKGYRRSIADVPRSARRRRPRARGGPVWAVRDVSFGVERGAALALVGSNGSGKSTLLRMLSGVTTPTRGVVRVEGRINALLTLGDGLHPLLTGTENALTGAMLSGMTRREARAALQGIADFAGLEAEMDQPVREYSDGMRLRLAFATAMAVVPEVLLIDEVLAVGDLRFRERCLNRLDELRHAGVTMVFVSHDLEQVERLCDRAIWLADGALVEQGTAGQVVKLYEEAMFASMAKGVPVSIGSDDQVRSGTHEIEITEVRLRAGGLETTNHVRTGDPLRIDLHYLAHRPIDGAIFTVSVHTEQGQRCLDVSTQGDDVALPRLMGRGTVSLELGRLDLAAGLYRLDVGVYDADWTTAYDFWWRRVPFEVHGTTTRGPLDPPRSWSLGGSP